MLKFIGILKLIILTTLITSCQNVKYDTSDISGTWYLIFKDTTYGEVIFTKNKLWEYNEQSGTYSKSYTIQKDTFKINDNQFKAKLIWKNKDEFDLVNELFTTHYFRLNIPLDTVGLLNDNEYVLDKYVNDWRERKYSWETEHKKKND
jgi:hypothetical protein